MEGLSRREFLRVGAGAAVGAGVLGFPNVVLPQKKGGRQLVVASFGGSYQAGQRKAYYQPFEAATGIKVVEDTLPTPAKIRAMVDSKNVTWDVAEAASSSVFTLTEYLEEIDYSVVPKDNLIPSAVHPQATGIFFYSVVLSINTKHYQKDGKHPKSWAEFWDVETFPGPRALDAGNRGWTIMEIALLADGVPKEKIYPLDMERAWKSLDRIKPHVVKWTTSFGQSMQLLVDGEVVMNSNPSNRLVPVRAQGGPVDFVWNEGNLDYTCWVIPRGTKHRQKALEFIAFSTSARPQAEMMKLQPGGPINVKAFDHLSEEQAKVLCTYEPNRKQHLVLQPQWWAEKGASGKSNYEEYQQRYPTWVLES